MVLVSSVSPLSCIMMVASHVVFLSFLSSTFHMMARMAFLKWVASHFSLWQSIPLIAEEQSNYSFTTPSYLVYELPFEDSHFWMSSFLSVKWLCFSFSHVEILCVNTCQNSVQCSRSPGCIFWLLFCPGLPLTAVQDVHYTAVRRAVHNDYTVNCIS